MATTFLTLPVEIRTIILKYALNAPRNPPLNPWTGANHRKPDHDINSSVYRKYGPRNTLYETYTHNDTLLTSTPLLLINHQIHNEVSSLLHHNRSYKPIYHLDIMYVNEAQLWPTWLSVPYLSTNIDEITVDIRVFGHCISRESLRWLCGDGGRDGVHWCFESLPKRFLVKGPVGVLVNDNPSKADRTKADSGTERKPLYPDGCNDPSLYRFSARTLILNIKSGGDDRYPQAPEGTTWRDYKRHSISARTNAYDLSGFAMRAEWLAPELSRYISMLLGDGYGDGLRRNVGCVRVLLEGVVYKEIWIGGGGISGGV